MGPRSPGGLRELTIRDGGRARVCVVGLGRVGLPTAVVVSAAGHAVVGVDRDPVLRDEILAGRAGALEPGLHDARAAAPFSVRADVVEADVYVVCVGRPADGGGRGDADEAVVAALSAIAAAAGPGALVLLECTVPVGTTDALSARFPHLRLAVVPERVLPGRALDEIRGNPRVVGGEPAAAEAAAAFVRTYCRGEVAVVDARTAELCKLVENTARDVQIALANTVASVARSHGVDAARLRSLANLHPRVSLLSPGIGVGGPCLPVDPWLLADHAPPLVAAARAVNDAVPVQAAARVDREIGTIGLLGLAYKPDTDDWRRSPAVDVARALAHRDVVVCDPHVTVPVPGVRAVSLAEALDRDVVVRLVAHRAFEGWDRAARPGARTLDLAQGWS